MPLELAPFTEGEYARRIAKTRKAMEAAGIDVLFVTDPSNQAWLTGYDGWSFYVHQGVILGLNGDPIWWGRTMDAFGALRTVWMEERSVIGYDDRYIQSTTCHPMEDLAAHLTRLGYGKARVGVEMENYYYSAKAHAVLQKNLPNASLHDATALVNWQRAVKSDEELMFIRRAARITENIVNLAIERARPGLRKNELVGDLLQAGTYGVGEDWGDYPAIVPLTPSGLDATAAHLTWDGREMQTGEATFFELSGCYRRYHAPLCRTVHLGQPPQEMLDASAALNEGIEAGIEAAKAGNRACDIANALNGALKKAGIDRNGRCGYPIGLSYPPDWGERTISLRDTDETVLMPGMTFHFMPALWMDSWGLETTETILIRENGPAEALCDVERKIFVKDEVLNDLPAPNDGFVGRTHRATDRVREQQPDVDVAIGGPAG
ncbi:M24 family metallopeptidase [Phaeobacter gallaeciensis]|uniref:M24 family metallopeptidase n=1 Tax=Rhodobacterales TaxID=204455 RepID=UPI00237F45F4|nr:M24 family metallopeptidase [Phaeobacter gallaeciensis]MDE4192873.1 M24 family metallopeptidase [Phaeobacter gallaeciensis]MDE4198491.1 M24 family metallopeptidase [Phaeobacter gallaeciensis]MDE4202636.1 M24 family metallopeptidase [Phaeobacter gallaeciensis]MDE4206068.1 M24 family metallopeptidase [Phaeobacter gallaeciensis]MDE4214435.1 M24 family metallopeptidase [Phaeobacter gallaeciensis]